MVTLFISTVAGSVSSLSGMWRRKFRYEFWRGKRLAAEVRLARALSGEQFDLCGKIGAGRSVLTGSKRPATAFCQITSCFACFTPALLVCFLVVGRVYD